jgi:acyl-CoA synthetase (AMP-forming)/AMP-acid ligase II
MTLTLADLARRAHQRYARSPAVYDGTGWWSFAELGAAARRTANRLLALGLSPGDRVVIALANCPESLVLDHAVFLSGLVRVAVSHRLHGRELAQIAADCGAAAVVCEAGHAEALAAAPAPGPRVIAGPDAVADLTGPGGDEADPDVPPPAPDSVAALMYTSGTTGDPKGAIATHRGWMAMVRAFWAALPPIGPGDVVAHLAPMSHFGGSAGAACTLAGAAAVPVRRYDPHAALALCADLGVTVLPLVPTMLKDLTAAAERDLVTLPALRAVPYGGSAISAHAAARAGAVFGDVLYQCYGLSEALAPITVLSAANHLVPAGADLPARLASAGRPVPEAEIQVTAPDGAPCPAGTHGEIRIRGAQVTPGYWNCPDETAKVLTPDGWLRTGDVGYLDQDGFCYLVGRDRDVIVSGGFNVLPAEVERAIAALPGVQEVVVFGVPHERWGEAVAAVVVPRDGHRLTADDVVSACRARLASYKKPVHVEFAAQLPVSATGKHRREQIRDRYWSDRFRQIGE